MNYISGYQRRNEDKWNMVRTLSFYTIMPHSKKGKINKPKDLFKLPSDSTSKPTMSEADRKIKAQEVKEYLQSKEDAK